MPGMAEAACTGSSPTWTAADTSLTEVTACVTAASSGDTINVPVGSSTWATSIGVNTKDLVMRGGGSGSDPGSNTVITCTVPAFCFSISDNSANGSATRITNFRFVNAMIYIGGTNNTKAFRVDHNYFQSSGARSWTIRDASSIANANAPQGLIDNNTFEFVRIVGVGSLFVGTDDNLQRQHKIYSIDPGFGGSQAIYVEDNVFTDYAGPGGVMDCSNSGRIVFRFNTISVTDVYAFEVHGVQGLNRACQRWELYGNTITQLGAAVFTPAYIRGGSGFYFDNDMSTGGFTNGPALKIERVTESKAPFDFCDGTWIIDGNIASGYPCRDQIGRPHDDTLYTGDYNGTTGSGAWPDQTIFPVYTWNNIQNSVQLVAYRFNGTATHNAEEREFYNYSSATGTPQTVGVRVGTKATMTAITTCTAGVGFWVTDEGSWNTSTSNTYGKQFNGADGVLYTCGASNDWSVHYTPYIYPHPLQGAAPTFITRMLRLVSWVGIVSATTWFGMLESLSLMLGLGFHFHKPLTRFAVAGYGALYQLAPRSYETMKVVSKESAVKALTVFNHLTKPKE